MSIYLDSCIVIYQVEEVQPWSSRIAEAILNRRGDQVVVSDLVRLECRIVPVRNGDSELLGRFSQAFGDMEFVLMNRAVFDRAAELRARHRIKTPDALHLSAALEYGCEEFWTNDDRLASVAGGITVRAFK